MTAPVEAEAGVQAANPAVRFRLGVLAACLAGYVVFILLVEHRFLYEAGLAGKPIYLFALLQFLAGIALVLLVRDIPRMTTAMTPLWIVIVTGFLFRTLMFGTEPILEIDFYRYLWDGGTVANSFNPYELAPAQVESAGKSGIKNLRLDAGLVFERINYAHLQTIYPPAAQLIFAIAHYVAPWQEFGLRAIYLALESLSLVLLLKVLLHLGRSPLWIMVYWWNPLVIKELMNSLHMKAILMPALLAFTLCLLKNRLR